MEHIKAISKYSSSADLRLITTYGSGRLIADHLGTGHLTKSHLTEHQLTE
jgi:hypothetical protein